MDIGEIIEVGKIIPENIPVPREDEGESVPVELEPEPAVEEPV